MDASLKLYRQDTNKNYVLMIVTENTKRKQKTDAKFVKNKQTQMQIYIAPRNAWQKITSQKCLEKIIQTGERI